MKRLELLVETFTTNIRIERLNLREGEREEKAYFRQYSDGQCKIACKNIHREYSDGQAKIA